MNRNKICVLFLLLVTNLQLFSNDTGIESAGGSLKIDNSDNTISIINERITLILENDSFTVRVNYEFFNLGKSIELRTGFPEYCWGTSFNSKLENFQIKYKNGDPIIFQDEAASQELQPGLVITNWKTK
ncbi:MULTISPECIES: hypothetical protein [unclassified Oceanispirochaeta]|uniref:hypothetical protein n=1 Tax=unclassified Oceanispirochaeta TaxID=2635722 RepID=UPI000E0987B1|nr:MULTISPECIES: hypothetical protein [unclassified Oceanispirochaeta]MBF9018951.1 hypothetical protein [Oceanispirochaeta sp. M2]NPD75436.1 hypothetical protein [Oceanispirochaeta sp. M1]RDG28706.1 hypothetical protein DV872_25420 [Oceanispirochaeta sp. M1]